MATVETDCECEGVGVRRLRARGRLVGRMSPQTPLLPDLTPGNLDRNGELAERIDALPDGWEPRQAGTQHVRRAAQAVDALWDEPDAGTEDARDGLIWVSNDEKAMADALRGLRAALAARPAIEGSVTP